MPRPTEFAIGQPMWIDLTSSDVEAAKAFYGGVFDWTPVNTPAEFGGYINFLRGDAIVAGLMPNDPAYDAPDGWSVSLKSADADTTAAAITAAGGHLLGGVIDVGGIGRTVTAIDPTGARITVWQPLTMGGFELENETGAHTWSELITTDFARAVSFYERAFGWRVASLGDSDEFRYSVLKPDGGELAGIMDGSAFLPSGGSRWQSYIGVDDADASLATAVKLGGDIVEPAEDTPFGRMATISDPTGATIKLHQVGTGFGAED